MTFLQKIITYLSQFLAKIAKAAQESPLCKG